MLSNTRIVVMIKNELSMIWWPNDEAQSSQESALAWLDHQSQAEALMNLAQNERKTMAWHSQPARVRERNMSQLYK